MTYDEYEGASRPLPSIDAVLDAHGARKVLAAAIAALLRGKKRKARPPDLCMAQADLSAHLRRDVGLGTQVERIQSRYPL